MNNLEKNLINKDKTWRIVICINPNHELIRFESNEIGEIRCPMCEFIMVVEVKPKIMELK